MVKEGYPDATAWDPNDMHHDPKSSPGETVWVVVEIKAEKEFSRPVTMDEIKANPRLQEMLLIRRGMRLSIQPVTKDQFDEIVSLGG